MPAWIDPVIAVARLLGSALDLARGRKAEERAARAQERAQQLEVWIAARAKERS